MCILRLVAKNERLEGRLELQKERECMMENKDMSAPVTYAVVAKRGASVGGSVRMNGGVKKSGVNGKTFAVVAKPSEKCARITNNDVKVLIETSELVKVHVRAVRKMRSTRTAIETASEKECDELRAYESC